MILEKKSEIHVRSINKGLGQEIQISKHLNIWLAVHIHVSVMLAGIVCMPWKNILLYSEIWKTSLQH